MSNELLLTAEAIVVGLFSLVVCALLHLAYLHGKAIREIRVTLATIVFGRHMDTIREHGLRDVATIRGVIATLDIIKPHDARTYERLAAIARNNGIDV